MDLSGESSLILVSTVLILVPRILIRFRVPLGITSFVLGIVGALIFSKNIQNEFIQLFAVLGISSLFLLAGVEINFKVIKQNISPVIQHIVIQGIFIAGTSIILRQYFTIGIDACLLVALALWTPSTGFILDSVGQWDLSKEDRFWVKIKAVSAEILSIFAMFAVTQSGSYLELATGTGLLVLFLVTLPFLFHYLARLILPFSKGSEFSLLVLLAIVCAVYTKSIGAYYLIGAFCVGLVANQFIRRLHAVSTRQTLDALTLFSGFFVPFYFFQSGAKMLGVEWSTKALLLGAAFVVVVLPLRILLTILHRRITTKEDLKSSAKIAVGMAPNLIFGLVIAGIIRTENPESSWLIPSIVIYTIISSLLPVVVLGSDARRYYLMGGLKDFFGKRPAKAVESESSD